MEILNYFSFKHIVAQNVDVTKAKRSIRHDPVRSACDSTKAKLKIPTSDTLLSRFCETKRGRVRTGEPLARL